MITGLTLPEAIATLYSLKAHKLYMKNELSFKETAFTLIDGAICETNNYDILAGGPNNTSSCTIGFNDVTQKSGDRSRNVPWCVGTSEEIFHNWKPKSIVEFFEGK